jgi:hypothetical protein
MREQIFHAVMVSIWLCTAGFLLVCLSGAIVSAWELITRIRDRKALQRARKADQEEAQAWRDSVSQSTF